jgi:DNA-binding MarR family transcriptional regulator
MAQVARDGLEVVRDGLRREFPDADADAATVVLALVGAARRVDAWLQGVLKPLGLADASAAVLLALALDGPPYRMSVTDLNEMLVVTSGGMTRTVDRLEDARLVTRLADAEDGRRVLVQLTKRGHKAAGRLVGALVTSFGDRVGLDESVVGVLRAFDDLPTPR